MMSHNLKNLVKNIENGNTYNAWLDINTLVSVAGSECLLGKCIGEKEYGRGRDFTKKRSSSATENGTDAIFATQLAAHIDRSRVASPATDYRFAAVIELHLQKTFDALAGPQERSSEHASESSR